MTLAVACVPPATNTALSPIERSTDPTLQAHVADLYHADTATDEFTGTRRAVVYLVEPHKILTDVKCTPNFLTYNIPSIAIARIVTTKPDTAYALRVGLLSGEWAFVRDDSLPLTLDGQRFALAPLSTTDRDVSSGGSVSEVNVYAISPADMRQIYSASRVRMRLDGERRTCDLTVPQESLELLKRFYLDFVPRQ